MQDFVIHDPRLAKDHIHAFPPDQRRLGERAYHTGAVTGLEVRVPRIQFVGTVQDGEAAQTATLLFERRGGWSGWCSCGSRECCHLYAAFKRLLAEHGRAAVQALTTSGPSASEALAASRPAQAAPGTAAVLPGKAAQALGRDLTTQERRYIGSVFRAFQAYGKKKAVNPWMFSEMGFRLSLPMWGTVQIWPEPPVDDYEFWLYVANKVLSEGAAIPAFLEPVTDLKPIEARFARLQRQQEAEEWTRRLAQEVPVIGGSGESTGETELRAVIAKRELRLETRAPGQESYTGLRTRQLDAFAEQVDNGEIVLESESERLWAAYLLGHDGGVYRLDYLDEQQERALNRMLRPTELRSRVVDARGRPFTWAEGSLRLELTPAGNEDEDYVLRLQTQEGNPAPPILCAVPGRPTLYLTETAIYPGPPLHPAVDLENETRIPAVALETPGGLAFLRSMGIEPPPRMRDRIQMLPFAVIIECALASTGYLRKQEDCLVTLQAEAPDGARRYWGGSAWVEDFSARPRHPAKGVITCYDERLLHAASSHLRSLDLRPFDPPARYSIRVTKKFPEAFAAWLKGLPPGVEVRLVGELQSLLSPEVAGRVKLEVSEQEIDWFDLKVVLDVSDTTLTPAEIKLLLNARGGYVRLPGKGWRRLKYDLSEEEDERLARLGLNPRELSAEPQRLHALQLADPAAKRFLPDEQVEAVRRRASEIQARVKPELPAGIKADLRPYQVEGFHFLAYLTTNRFGGILADDMGLGKTLQALAWLVWLRHSQDETAAKGSPKPSLVVCPKSVADNWHAEAERFAPELRVRVWAPSELPTLAAERASANLHVINYSQLRILGEDLAQVPWLAVILDEGQYIKNPSSQTAQIARALRAEHRLVLSGTPIENRLMDLWSLMAFAMPGILGSRNQFGKIYDAKGDPFARRRLAARVRPFLLRRTKNQVARDLPDRVEEDLFCEIEGEQQTLYRAELKRARQMLLGVQTQKQLAEERFNFLASLLRLRQICCHPRLVSPESQGPSAKAEALLEQLEPLMEEGQKVLVFSQFVELLHLLKPELEKAGWPLFYLAGETENRGDLVRRFQEARGPGVFLISLKAGGFGLNLTAASYVVLFDPWWNPAVENQAIDRTHRIGQQNKVIAYRLLIKNSIEEKIRTLQKQKKALAEDVLGEEKFAQSLTLDDLRFLFSE